MVRKSKLRPWLRDKKWLWVPTAVIWLIMVPFVWVVITLWEERRELFSALQDGWQLLTLKVEESE